MKECCGLFGKWFGHHYVQCYDEESQMPPEVFRMRIEVSNFVKLFDAYKSKQKTYVHSVCTRCGDVIHREESNE